MDKPSLAAAATPRRAPVWALPLRLPRTAVELARRQLEKHRTFVKFSAVGAIGYVIYLALLFVMYDREVFPFLPAKGAGVDLLLFTHDDSLLLITTLIGTQLSIIAVFAGHNLWTFADRQSVPRPLWLRFLQFQGRALVSTLGILTVAVNVLTLAAGVHPTLAVPVGLVTAFVWNWVLDSRVIWRPRPDGRPSGRGAGG
ncbi:MAG: GtrA family protein [Dehalococcoidia bacterium]|nr:GtrA family protein [Dehalococcoidia bacterium]